MKMKKRQKYIKIMWGERIAVFNKTKEIVQGRLGKLWTLLIF